MAFATDVGFACLLIFEHIFPELFENFEIFPELFKGLGIDTTLGADATPLMISRKSCYANKNYMRIR